MTMAGMAGKRGREGRKIGDYACYGAHGHTLAHSHNMAVDVTILLSVRTEGGSGFATVFYCCEAFIYLCSFSA